MTNKEIKKLVETLEHTLVSMQNKNNTDTFNVKMLRGKVELKDEIISNRNKQVKELSDKIQELERENSILRDLTEVQKTEVSNLRNSVSDFEKSEMFIKSILDNPSLTDMETVTEIRKYFK